MKQDMLSMAREAEMMKNMRKHLTVVTSWRKNMKRKRKRSRIYQRTKQPIFFHGHQ